MPVYSYLCEACETRFDAFASIAKKEAGWRPLCPKCGSDKTRQIFQSVALMVGTRPPSSGGCCSPRRQ